MLPFRTFNKKIACKPSEKYSMEAPQVKRGFAMPEERSKLFELETVFIHFGHPDFMGRAEYPIGTKLYLASDAFRHEWNRQIYNHADGTQFILVPEEMVFGLGLPESVLG